jgi:hypothetical protein
MKNLKFNIGLFYLMMETSIFPKIIQNQGHIIIKVKVSTKKHEVLFYYYFLKSYRVFQLDMTYFEVPDDQKRLTSKIKKS